MNISKSRSLIGLCIVTVALFTAGGASRATAAGALPRPMSYPRAPSAGNNSQAMASADQAAATSETAPPVAGGNWTALAKAPAGLGNPLLLTDGTVMVQRAAFPEWYRLTPDINGNYTTGTWSTLASLPMIRHAVRASISFFCGTSRWARHHHGRRIQRPHADLDQHGRDL